MKCVSADIEGNTALAKEIKNRHGRVDTVIANAGMSLVSGIRLYDRRIHLIMKIEGICDLNGDVSNIPVAQLEEHFHVH